MSKNSKQAIGTAKRDLLIIVGVLVLASVAFLIARETPEPPEHQHQTEAPAGQMPSADADFVNQLPKDYESLVHMGNEVYDQGNFAMAAEIYRRALEIDGSSPDVRTDFGACLNAMGLPQRAVTEFTRVVTEHPTHKISHFNLGIVYQNMDRLDSAKYYWEKYLELEPTGEMADHARQYISQMDG